MRFCFSKYHGTGNDFIIADNRINSWKPTPNEVSALCDRKYGIGSDGLILIEPEKETDFYMNFFNPDGSQSFCGNGSRCAISFARSQWLEKKEIEFSAIDGKHRAVVSGDEIAIKMSDVQEIRTIEQELFFLHTGSPHIVSVQRDIRAVALIPYAQKIRYSDNYKKEGVNVNLLEFLGNDSLFVRTYERGVENETLSCGTGVTAAALVSGYLRTDLSEVNVETPGGNLRVKFEQHKKGKFRNIWLCGPAVCVFEGMIEI